MHVESREEVDIAVVGAGPAGLSAAIVAAQAGARVLVLERGGRIGGRLGLQVQPLQGPRSIYGGLNGVDFCRHLLDEAVSAGAEVMLDTRVSELRPLPAGIRGFGLSYASAHGHERLRARALVLATGSREPWSEFPGSTLRGVMLAGDAQVMLNVDGVIPGRRVLMVGSDNAGLLIAADLRGAGARIVAVVDESPRPLGREANVAPLRDAGVPILTSYTLIAAHGEKAVESGTIACVDPTGTVVPGTERSFDVDAICLAEPRTPESELAVQAGCPLCDIEAMGGAVPVHNRRMETPVTGLYVCGDLAGVENGAASLEAGRLAGLRAAKDLGYAHPKADVQEKLARARLGYLRRGSRGLLKRRAKATLDSEYTRLDRIAGGISRR